MLWCSLLKYSHEPVEPPCAFVLNHADKELGLCVGKGFSVVKQLDVFLFSDDTVLAEVWSEDADIQELSHSHKMVLQNMHVVSLTQSYKTNKQTNKQT